MKLEKEILRLWLPFAAICIFLSGCYRDAEYFIKEGSSGDIEQFFDAVQTLETITAINPNTETNIITADNTILTIPASAFQDINGNVVNSETIDFEYLVIKDKGLLVMYNKPTISDGILLESGGVFYFEARNPESNETFYLREGYSILVRSIDPNPQNGMELFTGEEMGAEYNWNTIENDEWGDVMISEWGFQDSTIIEGFGYEFLVDSLTWINCDVFYDLPDDQKTSACVTLPEIYTNQNTVVFGIFTDINSVIGLYGNPDTEKFCDNYDAVPIGFNITFVSISVMGNDIYHFGMKSAVISENHEEFIVPEIKTLEEILDILGMF